MNSAGSSALVTLSSLADVVRLVVVVAVCALVAALVRRFAGLGEGREELVAVARATLQLAAVGAVIALVLQSWWATGVFLAVMVLVAAWTLVIPLMGVVALVFIGLWVASLRLGGRVDRERAEYDAAHPDEAPNV